MRPSPTASRPRRLPPARALAAFSLAALALAACSEAPTGPAPLAPGALRAAATVENNVVRAPLVVTTTNPCTGEPIDFTGFFQTRAHTTTNDHRAAATATYMLHADGVGQVTGVRYVLHESGDAKVRAGENGATIQSAESDAHYVGRGGAPDYTGRAVFRLVTNANGQVTVDVVQTDMVCRG